MIIYARLCLAKTIFFRVLIKYLAHNHPHIITISFLIITLLQNYQKSNYYHLILFVTFSFWRKKAIFRHLYRWLWKNSVCFDQCCLKKLAQNPGDIFSQQRAGSMDFFRGTVVAGWSKSFCTPTLSIVLPSLSISMWTTLPFWSINVELPRNIWRIESKSKLHREIFLVNA